MASEKEIDAIENVAMAVHMKFAEQEQHLGIVEARRFIWDDHHWRLFTNQDQSDMQPFMTNIAHARGIVAAEKAHTLWHTIDAKTTPRTRLANLDSEGPIVSCDNCLVNLELGLTCPHDHRYWVTRRLKVEYDEHAECPKWEATLERIWGDIADPVERQAMIKFLQEWFGTALIRSNKVLDSRSLKRGLFVYGPQGTGKTTIAQVLRMMFGNLADERVSAATMNDLSKDFGLEPLLKAQAIITDEGFNEGVSVKSNVLKKLITNEPFQVAIKGQTNLNNFVFKGPVLFTANGLPSFNDTSGAIYDRLIAVPVNRQFTIDDVETLEGHGNIWEMLKANNELPGILNWARRGYLRVIKRGHFEIPRTITNATLDWRYSNDPAFSFLRKCTVADPKQACGEAALSALASYWAKMQYAGQHQGGVSIQIIRNKLAATILEAMPTVRRRGEASSGDVHYSGLALNPYGVAMWAKAEEANAPMCTPEAAKSINVPLLT